jgi:hypothetical protein
MTQSTLEKISKLEGILKSLDKGNLAYQAVQQQLQELRNALPQEALSSPESPKTQEKESNHAIFQAIGVLKGKFVLETVINDEGQKKALIYLETEGKRFKTLFKNNFREALLNIKNNPEKEFFILVYPQLKFLPPKVKQPPELKFTIVGWSDKPYPTYQPNEFLLRGFWTFIPQNRTPVFQINRNYLEKEARKKLLEQGQDFKSIYVPVLWRDGVQPFRFNPKAEQQPDRYFCQIKAKFIANRQCFGFQELLAEPTTNAPRYLLSKAKLEKLAEKRQTKSKKKETQKNKT